jgi:hypothetical protein
MNNGTQGPALHQRHSTHLHWEKLGKAQSGQLLTQVDIHQLTCGLPRQSHEICLEAAASLLVHALRRARCRTSKHKQTLRHQQCTQQPATDQSSVHHPGWEVRPGTQGQTVPHMQRRLPDMQRPAMHANPGGWPMHMPWRIAFCPLSCQTTQSYGTRSGSGQCEGAPATNAQGDMHGPTKQPYHDVILLEGFNNPLVPAGILALILHRCDELSQGVISSSHRHKDKQQPRNTLRSPSTQAWGRHY